MLVYGDRRRRAMPASCLAAVAERIGEAEGAGRGIAAHAALVEALIEAGSLAQGIADVAFRRDGRDRRRPETEAAMALACALARAVASSWTTAFRPVDLDAARQALATLDPNLLPEEIELTEPEGFCHYAHYPEAVFEAARGIAPGDGARVIGIRSIGTTLAAMAAAAAPDTPPPVTLRPTGHPFRREIAADASLARDFEALAGETVLVADEGPGLSGSSFAAVAGWLGRCGIPADRVAFLPSHAGEPGPEADAAIRSVWARTRRRSVSFDELALARPDDPRGLLAWTADLIGPAIAPAEDLSGGAWRTRRYASPEAWPPSLTWQERRKILVTTASGRWLLRFAGLGRTGRDKLAIAERLARSGFAPEVAGLRHGFLVERWLDPAHAGPIHKRSAIVRQLAPYLGLRARFQPGTAGPGASHAELLAMARHNIRLALGLDAEACLTKRLARLPDRPRQPVATDNRLHPWEWIDGPSGPIKTDGVDHVAGHDLIGAQDIAWDIAGAAVEFELSPVEIEDLATEISENAGRLVDLTLISLLKPCYMAFWLGYYALGATSVGDPAEAARLRARSHHYRDHLRSELVLTGSSRGASGVYG